MRKNLMFIVLLFLMAAFTACTSTTESQDGDCQLKLSEMPFEGLDFTGMQVEDVADRPFPGSQGGQAMVFNEGTMLLSRYESSEQAAELMDPDNVLTTFGGDATRIVDAPTVSGDQTVWVHYTDDNGLEFDAAVVRYGDHVLLADPKENDRVIVVEGMLDTFDSVLLGYIGDHPECAYIHSETR